MSEERYTVRLFRADLSAIMNRVFEKRARATVMRHGEVIGVVLSPQEVADLDRMAAKFRRSVYTNHSRAQDE